MKGITEFSDLDFLLRIIRCYIFSLLLYGKDLIGSAKER